MRPAACPLGPADSEVRCDTGRHSAAWWRPRAPGWFFLGLTVADLWTPAGRLLGEIFVSLLVPCRPDAILGKLSRRRRRRRRSGPSFLGGFFTGAVFRGSWFSPGAHKLCIASWFPPSALSELSTWSPLSGGESSVRGCNARQIKKSMCCFRLRVLPNRLSLKVRWVQHKCESLRFPEMSGAAAWRRSWDCPNRWM